jgi:hypothetical protein
MAVRVMMSMTVIMTVVMVMAVMSASLQSLCQLAVQVGADQFLHHGVWLTRPHLDAVLSEQRESALADAAGDHHLDALLPQPARKQARLVWRRSDDLRGHDDFPFRVCVHQCEVGAPAEVTVQSALGDGEGDLDVGCIHVSGESLSDVAWFVSLSGRCRRLAGDLA